MFGALPDLPAVQRRVLALVELCDEPLSAVAAELGIGEADVRVELAAARKALRRGRAPLASGARCERAERLHSDRLDAPLERLDRRWLEIHMARCPRCIEHAELLDEARTELRVTFAAPAEKQLPPAAPEPPALEPGEAPRAQLRVVPPEPPAPDPVPPTPTPDPMPGPPAPEPSPPTPTPQPEPSPPTIRWTAARRVAKVVAIILAIAALLAGAGYGISQLGGDDGKPQAPWTQRDAPEVHPVPLSDQ